MVERERWNRQTKRGGGDLPPDQRGDCVAACITSVLGLPIDAVGNHHGDGWWDRYQRDLDKKAYSLVVVDMRYSPPPGYWIASVPSLNLGAEPDGKPALHAVVAQGYDLVHDPCLDGQYDEAAWTEAWNAGRVEDGWVIVPLDPASESEASR